MKHTPLAAAVFAAALVLGIAGPASAEMSTPPECQNDPGGGCQQGPLGGMGSGGYVGPLPYGVPWDVNVIMDQWKSQGFRPVTLSSGVFIGERFERADRKPWADEDIVKLKWASGYTTCGEATSTGITCITTP